MQPNELQEHISKTYFLLRAGLGGLGFPLSYLAVSLWPRLKHPIPNRVERVLLALRVSLCPAPSSIAWTVRWSPLGDWMLPYLVQGIFKGRKPPLEHRGFRGPDRGDLSHALGASRRILPSSGDDSGET